MKRIALVTGANKGIGFAIAAALADAGLEVIVGARDLATGRAAAARIPGARALELDVTSDASVRAAAGALDALDVLVNNAGVSDAADGDAATTPLDAIRRTFEANLFGVVAVTHALLPLLRRSFLSALESPILGRAVLVLA